jgi:prepilin signal peptidase PulO-like enzyme (type II secretory pathway)
VKEATSPKREEDLLGPAMSLVFLMSWSGHCHPCHHQRSLFYGRHVFFFFMLYVYAAHTAAGMEEKDWQLPSCWLLER